MGGKSKYNKRGWEPQMPVTNEKADVIIEKIKTKLGKKSLLVKEITEYLEAINAKKEDVQSKRTFTRKTVINYIAALCEDSNGLIEISDFKKNPGNEKSPYIIKPEIHGLLLALFDSEYFDGRMNDRKLATRDKLHRSLVDNIELYMSDVDKKIVKAHPSYITAVLESELSERLSNELSNITRTLYHSDPIKRYQLMTYVIQELVRIEKRISLEDAAIAPIKIAYADIVNKGEDGKYQKAIFQSDTLDSYMIKLLAHRVFKSKGALVNDGEIIPYPAISLMQKMFQIDFIDGSNEKIALDHMDQMISNDAKFKEIGVKARQILNLEDTIEALIYTSLMNMCKIYFLAPQVSKEDYKRALEYTEKVIAKNKWDILNDLYMESMK